MEDKRLQWADKVSLERIKLMHPNLQKVLLEDYLTINTKLPKGIRLRITQTLRTIEEQDALYAQGRTKPGKKVTNARGGSSYHNWGVAFDFVILYDNDLNGSFEEASYNEKKDFDKNGKADWMEVVSFFKSKGWAWGGDFRSIYDSPHFEKPMGLSVAQYRDKWNKGETMTDSNGKKYVKI